MHGNSYLDGDKVTFSCNGNHDLIGKAELSCVGRAWDSTVPECKGTLKRVKLPLKNQRNENGMNKGVFHLHAYIRHLSQLGV